MCCWWSDFCSVLKCLEGLSERERYSMHTWQESKCQSHSSPIYLRCLISWVIAFTLYLCLCLNRWQVHPFPWVIGIPSWPLAFWDNNIFQTQVVNIIHQERRHLICLSSLIHATSQSKQNYPPSSYWQYGAAITVTAITAEIKTSFGPTKCAHWSRGEKTKHSFWLCSNKEQISFHSDTEKLWSKRINGSSLLPCSVQTVVLLSRQSDTGLCSICHRRNFLCLVLIIGLWGLKNKYAQTTLDKN